MSTKICIKIIWCMKNIKYCINFAKNLLLSSKKTTPEQRYPSRLSVFLIIHLRLVDKNPTNGQKNLFARGKRPAQHSRRTGADQLKIT